jgi:hypothetical protein
VQLAFKLSFIVLASCSSHSHVLVLVLSSRSTRLETWDSYTGIPECRNQISVQAAFRLFPVANRPCGLTNSEPMTRYKDRHCADKQDRFPGRTHRAATSFTCTLQDFPARGSSRLHTTKGRKSSTAGRSTLPTHLHFTWRHLILPSLVRQNNNASLPVRGNPVYHIHSTTTGRSIPLLSTLSWSTANAAYNTCTTYKAAPALQKVPNHTDSFTPTQPHVLCHGQASASSPRLLG